MVEQQTNWQSVARKRWPMASPIKGTGRFAAISRCPTIPFVLLFDFAIEAQQAAAKACTHAFCHMAHSWVELKPAADTTKTYRRRIHIDD